MRRTCAWGRIVNGVCRMLKREEIGSWTDACSEIAPDRKVDGVLNIYQRTYIYM